MKQFGIFYGSDTGNTENIAKKIYKKLKIDKADIYDIAKCTKLNFKKYNILILGIPTWYYGEAQCDWNDFFSVLKKIKLKNKHISIFGCGDQEDYSEYFCDAIGIIYNIIKNLGAKIIGYWPKTNYFFDNSKGLFNKKFFYGLTIDEDRQKNFTNNRIYIWLKQINIQIHSYLI